MMGLCPFEGGGRQWLWCCLQACAQLCCLSGAAAGLQQLGRASGSSRQMQTHIGELSELSNVASGYHREQGAPGTSRHMRNARPVAYACSHLCLTAPQPLLCARH